MPTVALVDDDRNILTSVSIALEAEGYRIMTYTDGASALEGFKTGQIRALVASNVISQASLNPQRASAASISAATVPGGISDGVPPPKKIEVSSRPPVRVASCAMSASSAACHWPMSVRSRTWLLKSQ